MADCSSCGALVRPGAKVCKSCKAPVRASERYVDPDRGRCEYNDHGFRCSGTGSISLNTHEGGPWYCRKHALGLTGMDHKDARPRVGFKEHLESLREAAAEREAIVAE